MISVLIADDEQLIRSALAALLSLEEDIDVVALTGNGDEVPRLVAQHNCEVVLLDIDMRGTNGIDVAEKLHSVNPDTAIVMLTSHGRPGYLKRAVTAGARGFVTKDISADRLATLIREVRAGGRYLDPELAADAMFVGECPLGPRELEVLRLAEDGRSLASIARMVSLREGTVRNYLSAAITKLGVENRVGAIRLARSMGWL